MMAGSRRTRPVSSASIDFAMMLDALARPEAFQGTVSRGEREHSCGCGPSCPYSGDGSITVIQTHASAVVLTPDRVYKLKKPKDFGFFDYSTPALRRHFCEQEVHLNTRLAPQVYLGVAPVLLFADKRFCFGPVFLPDDVPLPGSMLDGGHVVDYAVVMVRLPDEASLESQVRAGTANPSRLSELARYVAAFHATSHSDEHIASFGGPDVIRGNWEESFEQMRPYVGRTLDAATYDHIVGYIRRFLEGRSALFASRVREGRIRDCHGDLRLQHVYLLDGGSKLAILDGIEFNERFRYSDVTSEVAFLTMELDAAGRSDLSRAFVDSYVAATGDEALRELLPFYTCYRACVRGKVLSFQLDEPEVPAAQREDASREAASLFALAASYAGGPTRPTLIMVDGLMGTGKSRLSLALHHELGWALFSSDTARKQLAQVDPAQPQADAFGQGLYSPEQTACTYQALRAQANAALSLGRSVLLDASFIRRADRNAVPREAAAQGATILFIECVCPREIALERLTRRWKARLAGSQAATEEASHASDGRPELYDAQCARWEAFLPSEEPHLQHLVVTTTRSLAESCEQVLDVLQMPRFACWLS
jgi:aminoglycoside phosphotransferase family enzyme/predicted kinase